MAQAKTGWIPQPKFLELVGCSRQTLIAYRTGSPPLLRRGTDWYRADSGSIYYAPHAVDIVIQHLRQSKHGGQRRNPSPEAYFREEYEAGRASQRIDVEIVDGKVRIAIRPTGARSGPKAVYRFTESNKLAFVPPNDKP